MSSPTMLQSLTVEPGDARWAASAMLWPTPPIDWRIEAGLEVCMRGDECFASSTKSQLKSTATEPATTMSALVDTGFGDAVSLDLARPLMGPVKMLLSQIRPESLHEKQTAAAALTRHDLWTTGCCVSAGRVPGRLWPPVPRCAAPRRCWPERSSRRSAP